MDKLVNAHGPAVMRLLLQVLDHRQEAEDAWQDTWFAVWRARDRIRGDRDPWPYIRQAALRKALDRRRGPAAPSGLEIEPEEPAPAPAPALPDLAALRPKERACLVLFFWEGLSVSEIAQTLDVPSGTVKTWMFRGRARLRDALAEREETR